MIKGLGLIGVFGKQIWEFVQHFLKLKQEKHEKKYDFMADQLNLEARIEEKTLEHEKDWDLIHSKQARFSWKDEFWTIVLSIPLVMCFIPGLETYAVKGFQNLEAVPEWYIIAVGVAMASAFGFRQMVNFMKK